MSDSLKKIYNRIEVVPDTSTFSAKDIQKISNFDGDGIKVVGKNILIENAETFTYDASINNSNLALYQAITINGSENSTTYGTDSFKDNGYCINRRTDIQEISFDESVNLNIRSVNIGEYNNYAYTHSQNTIYLESAILDVLDKAIPTESSVEVVDQLITCDASGHYIITGEINEYTASDNNTRTSFFALPGYGLEYNEVRYDTSGITDGIHFKKDSEKIIITANRIEEVPNGNNQYLL